MLCPFCRPLVEARWQRRRWLAEYTRARRASAAPPSPPPLTLLSAAAGEGPAGAAAILNTCGSRQHNRLALYLLGRPGPHPGELPLRLCRALSVWDHVRDHVRDGARQHLVHHLAHHLVHLRAIKTGPWEHHDIPLRTCWARCVIKCASALVRHWYRWAAEARALVFAAAGGGVARVAGWCGVVGLGEEGDKIVIADNPVLIAVQLVVEARDLPIREIRNRHPRLHQSRPPVTPESVNGMQNYHEPSGVCRWMITMDRIARRKCSRPRYSYSPGAARGKH